MPWGRWEVLREGEQAWILGLGPTVGYALEASEDLPGVGVVDARFVKPLDVELLLRLARTGAQLITVEDHQLAGGLGSAVAEALLDHGVAAPLARLGIRDQVVPHGSPAKQHEALGYGPQALRARLEEIGLAPPAADAEELGVASRAR